MSRVIVIVATGLALAGCASGGTGISLFEPTPVSVQFQSEPAGAEAKTSAGQVCQTPCALAVAPDKDFSVTFSLAGYEPQTVPVQASKPEDGESTIETSLQPNPVAVQLAKIPAKRPPAKKRATTASAAKPAAAKPAPKPAAPQPAAAPWPETAPAAPPPATDPWPPAR